MVELFYIRVVDQVLLYIDLRRRKYRYRWLLWSRSRERAGPIDACSSGAVVRQTPQSRRKPEILLSCNEQKLYNRYVYCRGDYYVD